MRGTQHQSSVRVHPFANLIPPIDEEELRRLVESIKRLGQLDPITTLDGLILDGRARFRACQMAGVKPRFKPLERETNPLEYVFAKNLHRRHLTLPQRRAIAVDALPAFEKEAKERQRLSRGRGQKGSALLRYLKGNATERAAVVFRVSARSIEVLKAIKLRAPEEFAAIKRGEKTEADVLRKESSGSLADRFIVPRSPS